MPLQPQIQLKYIRLALLAVETNQKYFFVWEDEECPQGYRIVKYWHNVCSYALEFLNLPADVLFDGRYLVNTNIGVPFTDEDAIQCVDSVVCLDNVALFLAYINRCALQA